MKLRVKCLENAHNPNLTNFYEDNIFIYLLKQKYDVEIVENDPHILLYPLSHIGHLNYKNCVKIFFTEESGFWNKNEFYKYYPQDRFFYAAYDADLILSNYYIDNKDNLRFPSYLWYYYQMTIDGRLPRFDYFFKERLVTDEKLFDRKFCVFIHQHKNPNMFRMKFLEKLNKYKTVDVWNSDQSKYSETGNSFIKTEFLKNNYKFCFSMEHNNGDMDFHAPGVFYHDKGYTTEKIIEPFCSNTIPLYWGNHYIGKEINTNMFINWHDYNNDEKMIEKILELDSNKDKYMEALNGAVFKEDYVNQIFIDFLSKVEVKLKEKFGDLW